MAKTLLATATASSSSSLSFTSGIDSTYPEYEFLFINMHPSNDVAEFQFQVNASGQTGFNEVITSTHFNSWHLESDFSYGISYNTYLDQAQGTAYQTIDFSAGYEDDKSVSGTLTLYNPSSTTYVKHFISETVEEYWNEGIANSFTSGYINTTNAITQINFKFSAGTIDTGTIKMFGVS